MSKTVLALGIALVATVGCSSPGTATSGGTAGTGGTGGTGGTASTTSTPSLITDVRGDRYCEVLIGHLNGATVHVDVYNTYGLDECPQADWEALDVAQIKASEKADVVVLNGPRYWTLDAFENSKLVDPTPKAFGTLEMRLAGTLDLAVADAMGGQKPYVSRTVARTTVFVFDAKKPVYELVDPNGKIFDMQSYSVQQKPQTEASLADLGSTLVLPAGWKFQTRTLDAELKVTAVDGMATVVQDDLANTYQLSQQ